MPEKTQKRFLPVRQSRFCCCCSSSSSPPSSASSSFFSCSFPTVSLSFSSFFFSVDLTCDHSPSPSLSLYVFPGPFSRFVFLSFPHPTLFLLPVSLARGGRYQKGFRNAFFNPLPPIPKQSFKGASPCDDRETQPSHPPRTSNKQWTPQNPQTRPKAPPISAPRTTWTTTQSEGRTAP